MQSFLLILSLQLPVARAAGCPAPPAPLSSELAAILNTAPSTAKPGASTEKNRFTPPKGTYGGVYEANAVRAERFQLSTWRYRHELEAFLANWQENRDRYEAVAARVDLPAILIAAIHWRESSGDFGTYLHQG